MHDKVVEDDNRELVALLFPLFCGIILLLLTISRQLGEGYLPYLLSIALMLPGSFYVYKSLRVPSKKQYDSQTTESEIKMSIFWAIWFSLLLTSVMIAIYEGPPPKDRIARLEVIIPSFLIWTVLMALFIYFPHRSKLSELRKKLFAASGILTIFSLLFFFGAIFELGASTERCYGIGIVMFLFGLILLLISLQKSSVPSRR